MSDRCLSRPFGSFNLKSMGTWVSFENGMKSPRMSPESSGSSFSLDLRRSPQRFHKTFHRWMSHKFIQFGQDIFDRREIPLLESKVFICEGYKIIFLDLIKRFFETKSLIKDGLLKKILNLIGESTTHSSNQYCISFSGIVSCRRICNQLR